MIFDLAKCYPVTWLCRFAEVSRAGYYKWIKDRPKSIERRMLDAENKEHIMAIHWQHPYYGYLRVKTALLREGIVMNHKKVRRLMREMDIRSVIRKKRPFAGRKPSVVFLNVLARDFKAQAPGQKFATDITYIRVGDEFIYLSVVMDLYNNEIVSWELSDRNDLQLVLNTVNRLDAKGAVLHSDQGFQYTSKQYASLLDKLGLIGSHSRRGNCFDNACIESFL